jgi:hypothetical protein
LIVKTGFIFCAFEITYIKGSIIYKMAELREKLSQYIGFKPEEIRLPITEEDKRFFQELIADQEEMIDIVNERVSIFATLWA